MNLQHAKNNPGTFQQMQATATKFDVKEGDFGPYALGLLVDNLGNEEKVLFAAKKDDFLPDKSSCMNSLGIWGVKYDANTGNFKAYYNGSVAKQLQNTPQGSQQATERPSVPPSQELPVSDAFVRHGILCAMLQGGISVDYTEVLRHTEFVISGRIVPVNNANPTESAEFCVHCGNPHAQCTCTPNF